MAELRALIGQLHAVPLDRKRPLWEYHFIEGLEDGSFAVYVKVHHSAMDGLAGMATLGVTFDFSPDAEHEGSPPTVVPRDAEPNDFIEMTSTAIGDFIRQGLRTVKSLPGVAKALTKAAPNLSRDARFLYRYLSEMPRTPFNRAISSHRVYATASLPFPEVRALAKARGVTVNDIVLALCAGALRRYLLEHAALPDKGLAVGVPASIRPPGNAQLNNQVVFTLSRLPTDVAEPLPRLAAAQAAGQEAKNLFADMRDLLTTDISIVAAPLVVMGLTRLWAAARGANYLWPFFNLVISNVPGPRQPLYCVGAPATHYFPISIPYHGCALNVTVQSYLDQLDFGLIACRETVPDAQRIADFIVEDFAALKAAVAELMKPDVVGKIVVALGAKPAETAKPVRLGEPKPPEASAPEARKEERPRARDRRAWRRDRRAQAPPRGEGRDASATADGKAEDKTRGRKGQGWGEAAAPAPGRAGVGDGAREGPPAAPGRQGAAGEDAPSAPRERQAEGVVSVASDGAPVSRRLRRSCSPSRRAALRVPPGFWRRRRSWRPRRAARLRR